MSYDEEATLELARAILAEDNRLHFGVDKQQYLFDYCYSHMCGTCKLFVVLCTSSIQPPNIQIGSEVYKTLTDEYPEVFL